MKKLVVIIGANAVGKTTAAQRFIEKYQRTAYIDSDWCRAMNPFEFTEVTKQTIVANMYSLLHNYLVCEDIDIVMYTYSWHGARKEMYEKIITKLRNAGIDFEENIIILKCSEAENRKRAIKNGRDEKRIERGMKNTFSFYDVYDYPCIDTTDMTPIEVAEKIYTLIMK